MQDPCKDCPRRRVTADYNCHSAGNYPEYEAFRKQQSDYLKWKAEENRSCSISIEQVLRRKRRKK